MIKQSIALLQEQKKVLKEKRLLHEQKNKMLELEGELEHQIAMRWMAIGAPILFLLFAAIKLARG